MPLSTRRRRAFPGLLAVLGLASIIAAGTARAQPDRGSEPAGIKAAGMCTLHTFNLDDSQPATVVVDFYKQGGGAAVPINLSPVAPHADFPLELAYEAKLTNGAYSGIVSGDRVLGNLSYCQWPASGGASIANQSLPATDVVLPILVKRYNSQSSLVSIQNTDPNQQAMVTVRLYQADQAVPLVQKNYTVEKGTSVTLDLGTSPDFDLVPTGLLGWLRVESATPVAVHSFVDYENSEKAVFDFEGVAVADAATNLSVPLVAHAAPMDPSALGSAAMDSSIAVVNPGPAPVTVAITYVGTGGTCQGQSVAHPAYQLPASNSATFYQGGAGATAPTGASGLPAGCTATARVSATGGSVVGTAVYEARLAGFPSTVAYAAAYDAISDTKTSRTVHLPYLRRNQDHGTSAVWVMNTGTTPAPVTLALTEAGPPQRSVACGAGCTVSIAPGQAQLWWLGDIADFGDGLTGFGTVTGDQALAAAVLDVPVIGSSDLSAYTGLLVVSLPPGRFPQPNFAPMLTRWDNGTRPTNTPRPTQPATSTPAPVTATPFPTPTVMVPTDTPAVPTDTPMAPTDTPLPPPTPTPPVNQVAPGLPSRVPPAVLADALANPDHIQGWQQPLDPGKPVGPYNPLRSCLSLRNPAVPWHLLFNPLIFRAGCP